MYDGVWHTSLGRAARNGPPRAALIRVGAAFGPSRFHNAQGEAESSPHSAVGHCKNDPFRNVAARPSEMCANALFSADLQGCGTTSSRLTVFKGNRDMRVSSARVSTVNLNSALRISAVEQAHYELVFNEHADPLGTCSSQVRIKSGSSITSWRSRMIRYLSASLIKGDMDFGTLTLC